MNREKFLIGIDVFQSRYDACFYNIGDNNKKYYTGSLINNYGKTRLINRIIEDDIIIINECELAAELMIRFKNQIIVLNDDFVSLLFKANIDRGSKMASSYVSMLINDERIYLSKKMEEKILIEEEKKIKMQEQLFDLGIKNFNNLNNESLIDLDDIYNLEVKTRDFNNCNYSSSDKIDEVFKEITKLEKLNKK